MKPKHNSFGWVGLVASLTVFVSFAFLLPSVFAQGETPTPSPEVTPEPLEIPEIEQGYGAQSLSQPQSSTELSGNWSASVNVSNSTGESLKPKIAADANEIQHLVWRETTSGGKQEIFYSWIDGSAISMPVNVSSSPSFNSDSPQLVADSAGIAHIVWQEEDNDQPDDFETLYSRCDETGCTSPTTLSDGQACGSYVGDWKATDPSIGIDGNDNLMVAWMSFEPNPRLYTMYSLWSASGSPPSNRTGCNLATGSYYYPVVAGDSNGDFHLLRMNTSNSIFYSKYSGGSWSANQTIGSGWLPVIHVDADNKIHAAWWNTNAPPSYRSKESAGSTWSGTENVFSSTICSDLSLITDGDNLPRLACAADAVYEASRQASGWTESIIVPGMASQPDLTKDVNGGLHLVWSDSSLGNWEISYSNLASGCTPDTFEPDDSLSTGNPISLGEEQMHSLCPQGDEDWVQVNLSSQLNLLIETFDLEPDDVNPNGNTQLVVKDVSQVQIGINRDRGFAPPSGSTQPTVKSSRVVWHPAINGVFDILVSPETPINEQASSGYSLRLVNPSWVVDPVDQASWGPTKVNVPVVFRQSNVIYFIQHFIYEQDELDALKNLNTTLAWEFRRPEVNTDTGVEIKDTSVDFGDYWQTANGDCKGGEFWTNLPSASDRFTEESNLISGCGSNRFWSEEFELFIDDPTQLIAGKVYYVMIKFYIHDEYLNDNYQFYLSKAEHCMVELYGTFCNVVPGAKSGANLIEGYLQPAP